VKARYYALVRGIISQSNFLPWRGYFASLREASNLIFYDSQQFTKQDWRNRNILLEDSASSWLTLPVLTSGKFPSPINEIYLSGDQAVTKVVNKIRATYYDQKNNPGYKFLIDLMLESSQFNKLSEINVFTTKKISEYLEIECNYELDDNLVIAGEKNEKLIQVCKHFNIDKYMSGAAALEYLNFEEFRRNGIEVEIIDYARLPKSPRVENPSIAHWLATSTREECIALTKFN